jgi:hypothetical protein
MRKQNVLEVFKIEEGGKKAQMQLLKIVGCTSQELKQHIENKFKPGMTWDKDMVYVVGT